MKRVVVAALVACVACVLCVHAHLVISGGSALRFGNQPAASAEDVQLALEMAGLIEDLDDLVLYFDFEDYQPDSEVVVPNCQTRTVKRGVLERPASLVPGPRGQAIRFENNSLCLDFLDRNLFSGGTLRDYVREYAVSMWVRPRESRGILFDYDYRYVNNDHGMVLRIGELAVDNTFLGEEAPYKFVFGASDGSDNPNWGSWVYGPVFPDNVWTHVAVSKNGTDVDIYVNGTWFSSGTTKESTLFTTAFGCFGSSNRYIRRDGMQSFVDGEFVGDFDEIRVFRKALDHTQAVFEYNR